MNAKRRDQGRAALNGEVQSMAMFIASPQIKGEYLMSNPTVTYAGADDVNRAIAAAKSANEMPYLKVLPFEEDFDSGVVTSEHLLPLSVELNRAQLFVEAIVTPDGARDKEIYSAITGTHTIYGNFVKLWSVRGPGDGPRQRPMFVFHDGEPVFIS